MTMTQLTEKKKGDDQGKKRMIEFEKERKKSLFGKR